MMRFYGLKPETASGLDALRARKERWWEIDLEYHGNRYLINDITSAIALAQLSQLDHFISKRKKIWDYYQHKLGHVQDLIIPTEPPIYTKSSYYFYWIQLKDSQEQLSLARELVNNGIYTTFRYYPLHLIDYYKSRAILTNSEHITQTSLNLPLHQNLSRRECDRIVSTVKQWVKKR